MPRDRTASTAGIASTGGNSPAVHDPKEAESAVRQSTRDLRGRRRKEEPPFRPPNHGLAPAPALKLRLNLGGKSPTSPAVPAHHGKSDNRSDDRRAADRPAPAKSPRITLSVRSKDSIIVANSDKKGDGSGNDHRQAKTDRKLVGNKAGDKMDQRANSNSSYSSNSNSISNHNHNYSSSYNNKENVPPVIPNKPTPSSVQSLVAEANSLIARVPGGMEASLDSLLTSGSFVSSLASSLALHGSTHGPGLGSVGPSGLPFRGGLLKRPRGRPPKYPRPDAVLAHHHILSATTTNGVTSAALALPRFSAFSRLADTASSMMVRPPNPHLSSSSSTFSSSTFSSSSALASNALALSSALSSSASAFSASSALNKPTSAITPREQERYKALQQAIAQQLDTDHAALNCGVDYQTASLLEMSRGDAFRRLLPFHTLRHAQLPMPALTVPERAILSDVPGAVANVRQRFRDLARAERDLAVPSEIQLLEQRLNLEEERFLLQKLKSDCLARYQRLLI
jgi:hypothetical protein